MYETLASFLSLKDNKRNGHFQDKSSKLIKFMYVQKRTTVYFSGRTCGGRPFEEVIGLVSILE